MANKLRIGPQPGPQTLFMKTPADICIYGGSAGGGKSYALLLEPLRHRKNSKFNALIFRRTIKQIKVPGGLWDESQKIYRLLNARPRESYYDWAFESGMKIQFAHLEQEKNIFDYQGSQIAMIGFDELTHFTERQFFYMLSRNRSSSGVNGYIRATTNPDSRSWVKKLISWWINPETGYIITERSGVVRWFVRLDDKLVWGDSKEDLEKKYGKDSLPKSLTFIEAKIQNNKILLEKDPSYLANLKALPLIDRLALLDANWNVEPSAGMFFKRHYFRIVDDYPKHQIRKIVRCWDKAATRVDDETPVKGDPDYTVGIKLAQMKDGTFIVLDMVRERYSTGDVEKLILNTARHDGIDVKIKLFQDPGSAGVYEANRYSKLLAGFNIKTEKIMVNKVTAAKPVSAQAEQENILVLKAKWNDDFFTELVNFPDGAHDDIVDAFSGAFNCLTSDNVGVFDDHFLEEPRESILTGMKW